MACKMLEEGIRRSQVGEAPVRARRRWREVGVYESKQNGDVVQASGGEGCVPCLAERMQ